MDKSFMLSRHNNKLVGGYWWFAYDVIKNIMINLPQILVITKFEVIWINENRFVGQRSWTFFYYVT